MKKNLAGYYILNDEGNEQNIMSFIRPQSAGSDEIAIARFQAWTVLGAETR